MDAVGTAVPGQGTDLAQEFFPIRVSTLRTDETTQFDLYILPRPGQQPVLYRERNLPFTAKALERLEEHNVAELYVPSGQGREYRLYIEQHLGQILESGEMETDAKAEILYTSAQDLVKDVMADPRSGDVFARSEAMVQHTVSFVLHQAEAFEGLLKVMSFDYYTYTHSVNVFVFSVALGRKLGLKETDVFRLGSGALLHDLGKCQIDPEIVNCRGKLSSTQWETMKSHPVLSHNLLIEQGVEDRAVLDITRHHHEKLTGSGYPDGIKGAQLSRFVRITTIADIFDALTTRRSYKEAIDSFPALKIMNTEMSGELDPEFFRTFIEMMGRRKRQQ